MSKFHEKSVRCKRVTTVYDETAWENPHKPVLYTTHCPMCKMLEQRLKSSGIEYEVCTDLGEMERLGIQSVPVLKDWTKFMNVPEAMEWIEKRV